MEELKEEIIKIKNQIGILKDGKESGEAPGNKPILHEWF